MEKKATYSTTNSYTTLNELSSATKHIWVVFHGIGYLSKYFVKYFENLPPTENYIIAPQAPSKYYLKDAYKYVGASWLTKENTEQDIDNVLNYLDAVMAQEVIPSNSRLIVLGFSQGVSIALRWVAKRRIMCDQLVLYAGGVPKELHAQDFNFLEEKTKVSFIAGKNDVYLTQERTAQEKSKIETLFNGKAHYTFFDGGHEFKEEIITDLI